MPASTVVISESPKSPTKEDPSKQIDKDPACLRAEAKNAIQNGQFAKAQDLLAWAIKQDRQEIVRLKASMPLLEYCEIPNISVKLLHKNKKLPFL